ncbi:hypothetical protein [Pseudomonas sp. PA15(2017)]|uniref:hypothetical protein n=1 Tax=Pseudomonas sp. PA15(2017) TaxID=1932111 RepID=UPI00117B2251|nr:hypothetical protein [Pseudomonas sp. PA15(2017)]
MKGHCPEKFAALVEPIGLPTPPRLYNDKRCDHLQRIDAMSLTGIQNLFNNGLQNFNEFGSRQDGANALRNASTNNKTLDETVKQGELDDQAGAQRKAVVSEAARKNADVAAADGIKSMAQDTANKSISSAITAGKGIQY